MKKLITLVAVAALAIAGCKHLPKPEEVRTLAYNAGVAAGVVVNMKQLPPETVTKIIEVVDVVGQVVPEQGKTWEEAWTAAAEDLITKFVSEGKLQPDQAVLVKYGVQMAGKTLDFVFNRHPKWGESKELVAAATNGLCAGFKDTVKTPNARSDRADKEVLKFLQGK